MRIITANLNGIRSAHSKGFFAWLQQQQADIVCVQELKAQIDDLSGEMLNPAGYHGYFHFAEKKGYSGVGIYAKRAPDRLVEGVGDARIDAEGRFLQADFGKLSVVSLYLPSGSSGEHRQTEKFYFMKQFFPALKKLAASGREIILCGDWNIAHRQIDLKNWRSNQKNSGFLPEERVWLTQVFDDLKWVDVYRQLHPDTTGESYTWWSNRGQAYANNVGWRIDYQIATPQLAQCAQAASIYKAQRFSDHAPLMVDYEFDFD